MNEPHEYPELEATMLEVGKAIQESIDSTREEIGFALFVFHLGEGGGFAYMSSAVREDMIKAIKEWLAKQGEVVP